MITPDAYFFILIALVIAFIVLTSTLIILIKRKNNQDFAETFKTLVPSISSVFDNPFFWIDPDNATILYANERALEMLSFTEQEMRNKSLNLILSKSIDIKNDKAILQGKTMTLDIDFVSKNKKLITLEINIIPLKAPNQVIIGYLLIAEDMQEKEKSAIEEISQKYQQLLERRKLAKQIYAVKIDKLNSIIQDAFKDGQIKEEGALIGISEGLHNLFESYLTTLWISTNEDGKFKLIAQYGLSDEGIQRLEDSMPTGTRILKAIERKQASIEDVSTLQGAAKNLLIEEGVFAIAEIPFFKGNSPCGIIEIYLKNKEEFEAYEQSISYISTLITTLCSALHVKIVATPEIESVLKERDESEKKLLEKIRICEHDLGELKQLQNLTMGRELRMMELKRKIGDLEDALEKCGSKK